MKSRRVLGRRLRVCGGVARKANNGDVGHDEQVKKDTSYVRRLRDVRDVRDEGGQARRRRAGCVG